MVHRHPIAFRTATFDALHPAELCRRHSDFFLNLAHERCFRSPSGFDATAVRIPNVLAMPQWMRACICRRTKLTRQRLFSLVQQQRQVAEADEQHHKALATLRDRVISILTDNDRADLGLRQNAA